MPEIADTASLPAIADTADATAQASARGLPARLKKTDTWADLTSLKNWHFNLIGAILIGLCVLYTMPYIVMVTGRNDFAHFYIGGLLYGTPAIHSAEANQQKQIELTGVIMANSYFIRPTFYGFLLKPLSWLPYYPAYLVFQTISVMCLTFFLRSFAPGRHDLLILAAMTPPLIANFVLGQDVMLLVGILAATLVLARRGADFTAGLILPCAPSSSTCSCCCQRRCCFIGDSASSGAAWPAD